MHYKYLVARIIFDLKKLEIKLTIFTISHVNSQYMLVNETRALALVQEGTQTNQFTSAIDRTGNITKFTENRAEKSFFFVKT